MYIQFQFQFFTLKNSDKTKSRPRSRVYMHTYEYACLQSPTLTCIYTHVCLQCGGMSFFGFGGNKNNLEDELFNLKFSSKQLQKESKKVIGFVCQGGSACMVVCVLCVVCALLYVVVLVFVCVGTWGVDMGVCVVVERGAWGLGVGGGLCGGKDLEVGFGCGNRLSAVGCGLCGS